MSNRNSLARTGLMATVALGAVAAFAGIAHAQTADPPTTDSAEAPEAQPNREEVIVVVGSRIRRDEFSSASPIQVITREESTLAGLASTTEVLQGSSVSGGSNQVNNLFGGFVVDGGPGVNTIGLRGLGATRTLVLLNGRRIAPAGTRGAVGSADLNVLPTAMVERIEILKDGASSIYGSDAVAGVVNIITREGIDGWDVEAFGSRTQDGGGDQFSASVVGGFGGDNWNISGSLEYFERTDLKLKDRGWALCNIGGLLNATTGKPADYLDPDTGRPKCYPIAAGTGTNGVTINTIGTSAAAGVAARGAVGSAFNRWRPNSAVTTGLAGFEGVNGSLDVRDTFDPLMLEESIISPVKIYNGFLKGSVDMNVLGNAEGYFELLGTKRLSEQTGYRQGILDYPRNSPLIPANLQFSNLGTLDLGYPVGVRTFVGWGNDTSSQEVDYVKGTVGVRGDFLLSNWRYDAYMSYATSDATYTFEQFLRDRLTAAMNGCPAGAPAGCVSAPPLSSQVIGGQLPENFRNYVFTPITGNTQYDEAILSFVIDGPVFQLPAGSISAALGVEHRYSEIDDTPDNNMITGNLYNFSTATPTRGSDSVSEVFGEIEVPLLAKVPFAEELTVNLSARYTDYESYGSDETYKTGIVYAPTSWLSFRAAQGTSYRAPALFEQFQGPTSGFLNATTDPCYEYGAREPTSIRYQNCDAELMAADPANFRPTQGPEIVSEGGAAAGLRAETSTNTSYGVVLQPELPQIFGDISLAVDYYEIEIEDQVDTVPGAAIMRLCYDDPQFRSGGSFCRLVSARRPAQGNSLRVSASYINIATQYVSGYDYNLRWVKDIGEGTVRVNALVTQFTEQRSRLFSDDPWDETVGLINSPEYTASADFYYDYKDWRFFWQTNWLSEQDSNEYLGLSPTGVIGNTQYDFTVDAYTLHNASIRYRSPRKWEITTGVRNVFDEEPPFISAGAYNRVGNSPLYSGYDYFGRTVFVNVAKSF